MIEPEVRPAIRRCRAVPLLLCVLVVASAPLATPALTQGHPPARERTQPQDDVSVALVLAVDTSGSVSTGRFELQKQGYAAAFRNPQVLGAVRSLGTQSIAVTMFQWTGPLLHVVVADWTLIKDQPSAERFAAAVQSAPRRLFGGGTSISGAIDHGRVLLAQSPYHGARRIIDISGDGSNNSGRPAAAARNEAVADGIGINGLPILTVEPSLDRYYANNVIGGPGAFMIPARNYDTFANAVLKKLINEIAMFHANDGRPHGPVPLSAGRGVAVPQTRPSLRENSSGCSPSRDGARAGTCAPFTPTLSIPRRWLFWRPPSMKPG